MIQALSGQLRIAPAKAWLLALAAAASALLAACGGGGGSDTPSVAAPTISSQPMNQSPITGSTATFSVTASGTGLAFQWQRGGTAIAGATASSYTTPAVTYLDSGAVYSVVVTNAGGAVTSSNATLDIALSADQQTFESLILTGGGNYEVRWNLNYSGPETSGVNYAFSDFAVETQSPASHGPQTVTQSAPVNIATTLAPITGTPLRILKNGTVLVVPIQNASTASYVGSQVRIDYLASDNTTVAWSQLRSSFALVPLVGNVKATTGDFAQFHNSFFSNPAILKGTTSWATGAVYETYLASNVGDRYTVFDCRLATTGASPDPCSSGTLTDALTAGEISNSDGVTYHLADGTITTIGGVPIWVATAPRPQTGALSSTLQYRIYFQLNGNIYTGSLIKDGAALGGSYYVSTPGSLVFLPFQLRMNKAARDSLAADMNI